MGLQAFSISSQQSSESRLYLVSNLAIKEVLFKMKIAVYFDFKIVDPGCQKMDIFIISKRIHVKRIDEMFAALKRIFQKYSDHELNFSSLVGKFPTDLCLFRLTFNNNHNFHPQSLIKLTLLSCQQLFGDCSAR